MGKVDKAPKNIKLSQINFKFILVVIKKLILKKINRVPIKSYVHKVFKTIPKLS